MSSQAAETINEAELAAFAERIVASGLAAPALFLLELHKPLNNVFYNLALFAQPLASPLIGPARMGVLRKLFSERDNMERLCRAIELAQLQTRAAHAKQNGSAHGTR